MERPVVLDKIWYWIKQYKFVLLILILGLVFMLFPSRSGTKSNTESTTVQIKEEQTADAAAQLAQILSQIQGVGKVEVMLTILEGEKYIYQEDSDVTTNESGSTIRTETVVISHSDRSEEALISYIVPPKYLGAIIVCQGAEQASVKLAILDAVSKVTGLSVEHISIVKMK